MNVVVVMFLGFNCDDDCYYVFGFVFGVKIIVVWYGDLWILDGVDVVVLLGGFFYGDYLCIGVIVRFSVIMLVISDFV